MSADQVRQLLARVWLVHALYTLPTAIWALLGIRSFQRVSGPKVDLWLVRTVAGLIGVIGAVIGSAGARRKITPEIAGLAVGSSAVLATIDVVYTSRGRISRVYLLDALANSMLIVSWIAAWKYGLVGPGNKANKRR